MTHLNEIPTVDWLDLDVIDRAHRWASIVALRWVRRSSSTTLLDGRPAAEHRGVDTLMATMATASIAEP